MTTTPSPGSVSAFEVHVVGRTTWRRVINARTAGQAKAEYFRDLHESWPSIPYTALRCRLVGPASSSEDFIRCAAYRGVPDARCGQRVVVGESRGVIVGHNGSANFEVLFDSDALRYAGLRLSVHPSECQKVKES